MTALVRSPWDSASLAQDIMSEWPSVSVRALALPADDTPSRIFTTLTLHADAARARSLDIGDTVGRAGFAPNLLTVSHREGAGETFEQPATRSPL